jgi:hypothetical protein
VTALLNAVMQLLGAEGMYALSPVPEKNIGVLVERAIEGGDVPVPRCAVVAEGTDTLSPRASLDRLLGRFGHTVNNGGEAERSAPWGFLRTTVRSEIYGGERLFFYDLPVQGWSPSGTVLGNHLVLGTGTEVVKSCIDVYKGNSPSLLTNSAYKQLTRFVSDKPDEVIFLDGDAMATYLKALGNWILLKASDDRLWNGVPDENGGTGTYGALPELRLLRQIDGALIVRRSHDGVSYEIYAALLTGS